MKKIVASLILGLSCGPVMAHELTPSYPEFGPSFMDNISVTRMEIFNAREEVDFYAIDVYTEDWEPIPFSTRYRVIPVSHLERYNFEIYIRDKDLDKVEYICTTSRLMREGMQSQGISSRVCSRVK